MERREKRTGKEKRLPSLDGKILMRWFRCGTSSASAPRLPLSPALFLRLPSRSQAPQHYSLHERTIKTTKKNVKQEDILGSVRRSLFPLAAASTSATANADLDGSGGDGGGAGSYSGAPYCVLVLDEVTTPIVSGATSVSEVLDYGVARE